MDWASRKVLASWRLSNTLDASFCVEALKEAICSHLQIRQTRNHEYRSRIAIHRHGLDHHPNRCQDQDRDGWAGRYLDNIFIERLWRSLKQEAVYLHELQDYFQAKCVIDERLTFYNTERPHTALDKRAPDDAYFEPAQKNQAA